MSRTTLPKRRRNGASFHASVPRRFRRISTPMRPSSLPVFLPRVSPFFLCPLDRPRFHSTESGMKRQRRGRERDGGSGLFYISRGSLCQTHSLEYRFLRVFVSEARNSACPSQLRGRDTRFAAKAASGNVEA